MTQDESRNRDERVRDESRNRNETSETFKTGFSGSGLAVDTLGNVWIANKLGNSERGRLKMLEMAVAGTVNYNGDPDHVARLTRVLTADAMAEQMPGWEDGSLTVLHPDGTEASFSPVYGKGISGPWAAALRFRNYRVGSGGDIIEREGAGGARIGDE
jgi:hypothetical protein